MCAGIDFCETTLRVGEFGSEKERVSTPIAALMTADISAFGCMGEGLGFGNWGLEVGVEGLGFGVEA